MKFKSFFKRTWHPQQMENAGRFNGSSSSPAKQCPNHHAARMINETELGELKSLPPETDDNGSPPSGSRAAAVAGVPCRNGACKSHGLRPPHHRLDNPWHYLKTVFLVSIIVAFVVWIIVFVLLTQYDVL